MSNFIDDTVILCPHGYIGGWVIEADERCRKCVFEEYLKEEQANHDACEAALKANPNGGNYYKPHPFQIDSGTYWRCAHGRMDDCDKCKEADPEAYKAWNKL